MIETSAGKVGNQSSDSAEMLAAVLLRPKLKEYKKLNVVLTHSVSNASIINSFIKSKSKSPKPTPLRPHFTLDCCDMMKEKLPQYNDLNDEYLGEYFKRRVYYKQLAKIHKITTSAKRYAGVQLQPKSQPLFNQKNKNSVERIYEHKPVPEENLKLPDIGKSKKKKRKANKKKSSKKSAPESQTLINKIKNSCYAK